MYRLFVLLSTIIYLSLGGCRQTPRSMSFYYWRTTAALDSTEKRAIKYNSVSVLYTRYFDVDFLPGDSMPVVLAPIHFDSAASITTVIPVVYIKNRTFIRLDTTGVSLLANKIHTLVSAISQAAHTAPVEIGFDCDWTETTRNNYFRFLADYKKYYGEIVSATIRLHQVKYAGRTGIPPVDHGVLMYYNMGEIGSGSNNSIYDKTIAARYVSSLKNYPMQLDVALPIFAWGLQIREKKVIRLLNKMNFLHFENDTNFIASDYSRFLVKNSCFHGGYYFKTGDVIKTEHVPEADLLSIAEQVNNNTNHRIRNIIFYDLDKENLALYDENIFHQILDHFN